MTEVKGTFGHKRGGWIPDIPDNRDLTLLELPDALRIDLSTMDSLDGEIDLVEFFSDAEDQKDSRATVAYACGALVEYFSRRCLGKLTRLSKPFLYDVARRLDGITGDSGVSIRSTLKALRRVGLPPASCVARHESPDLSLDPLLYSFSAEYRGLGYFRVDKVGLSPEKRLRAVRKLLQLEIPVVFGMPLLSCHSRDPRIDYRTTLEVVGGAAGVFVGYDDTYRMSSVGALRFLSSWGSQWGEKGLGWLSYRFIEESLVRDIWMVFDPKWWEHGDLPTVPDNANRSVESAKRVSSAP